MSRLNPAKKVVDARQQFPLFEHPELYVFDLKRTRLEENRPLEILVERQMPALVGIEHEAVPGSHGFMIESEMVHHVTAKFGIPAVGRDHSADIGEQYLEMGMGHELHIIAIQP